MNKYKTVIFSIGVFVFSLVGAAPVTSNMMVLKDNPIVSGDVVRIKDVALMDSPTRDRIGDMIISVSPELGKSISIQKQEIYEKLVGNGFQSPEIKGPASITVLRKGMVVKPAFFKEQIYRYIIENSKWKDGVQVEIITAKEIVVPESGVRWQLIPANGQDFFGNVLFEVKAFSIDSNDAIYSNWITARLKIVKDVPISNRDIQKNQPITDTDIRWETREITAFTKDAILEKGEIIGQRADRIIRTNTVITSTLLEKKFLVKRGDMATLVAQLKSVKATTVVKALSDGSLGDSVQVMTVDSKKIITAYVTGKNTLEVNVQ
jgi:flagella basal body P-ring formation protein FlgA